MTAPLRYRVWCLSWDDEEHGSDVVGYDILRHDHKHDERGVVYVPSVSLTAAEAAETYADYAHGNRDGWESTWPLVFRVRCPDGTVLDFDVDREYAPEFTASPVKPTAPAAKEHVA